jgi:hypothetical protein
MSDSNFRGRYSLSDAGNDNGELGQFLATEILGEMGLEDHFPSTGSYFGHALVMFWSIGSLHYMFLPTGTSAIRPK